MLRGKLAIHLFLLKSTREDQFMMVSTELPTLYVMREGRLASSEDSWRKLLSDGIKDLQSRQDAAEERGSPKLTPTPSAGSQKSGGEGSSGKKSSSRTKISGLRREKGRPVPGPIV